MFKYAMICESIANDASQSQIVPPWAVLDMIIVIITITIMINDNDNDNYNYK